MLQSYQWWQVPTKPPSEDEVGYHNCIMVPPPFPLPQSLWGLSGSVSSLSNAWDAHLDCTWYINRAVGADGRGSKRWTAQLRRWRNMTSAHPSHADSTKYLHNGGEIHARSSVFTSATSFCTCFARNPMAECALPARKRVDQLLWIFQSRGCVRGPQWCREGLSLRDSVVRPCNLCRRRHWIPTLCWWERRRRYVTGGATSLSISPAFPAICLDFSISNLCTVIFLPMRIV